MSVVVQRPRGSQDSPSLHHKEQAHTISTPLCKQEGKQQLTVATAVSGEYSHPSTQVQSIKLEKKSQLAEIVTHEHEHEQGNRNAGRKKHQKGLSQTPIVAGNHQTNSALSFCGSIGNLGDTSSSSSSSSSSQMRKKKSGTPSSLKVISPDKVTSLFVTSAESSPRARIIPEEYTTDSSKKKNIQSQFQAVSASERCLSGSLTTNWIQGQSDILPSPPPSSDEDDSFAIFRCPIALEKYNVKLWIVYLDNLLEVMFRIPLEALVSIFSFTFLFRTIPKRDYQLYVHLVLVLVPLLLLTGHFYGHEYTEVSYWYHAFRGQSTLKLYGVLMTADVVDKMLNTVGEYLILDVLWQKLAKASAGESVVYLLRYIVPTVVYVSLHSVVVFLQVISYNVILNSDISSLFVLVFVHNSMKLKSSIFKKFSKDAYTNQTHIDLRTRFEKFLYVFLIWVSFRGFAEDILSKLLYFLGSEIIIEWVKHVFLMLLNNLTLSTVESMSKSCKLFVAQVRIIPAFLPQEILNHKAQQTFVERESYLASTPNISASLKVGFRINFLAFHYAVIIGKFLYPHLIANLSVVNVCMTVLAVRLIQLFNDILLLKFSFNNHEIIKLYTLKNSSLMATLVQTSDIFILLAGVLAGAYSFSPDTFVAIIDQVSSLVH